MCAERFGNRCTVALGPATTKSVNFTNPSLQFLEVTNRIELLLVKSGTAHDWHGSGTLVDHGVDWKRLFRQRVFRGLRFESEST